MIARPKPEPDDGPEPELVTPKRIAAEWRAIALAASRLRIRAQSLAVYLAPEQTGSGLTHRDLVTLVASHLGTAGDDAVDLASAVQVGQVPLDERYLDPSCRPERPLLDAIERRPTEVAAEAIAPAVAARGDTDPVWWDQAERERRRQEGFTGDTGDNSIQPLQLPVEHPQAEPAKAAARRRNGRKGGDS